MVKHQLAWTLNTSDHRHHNHTLCFGSPADVITPVMLFKQMRLYEDDKTERHNFQMMY